jgi:hypothetical protein
VLKLSWNGLRKGDAVLVHDPLNPIGTLTPGTVSLIESRRGVNGVGIVVTKGDGDHVILWPSLLAVHSNPRDATEPCWRCDRLVPTP